MSATLEQLRAEHNALFVGPNLMRLLERVASATARTYPASYTPAGVWNEDSISDALQGWAEERLYGRRDLTNLLAGASSVASLRAGLTRSFGQYLTNGQKRSSATNLYARSVKMLRDEPEFKPVAKAPKAHEQLWTLASNPVTEPSSADIRSRLRVASQLSDDELAVVKYGPYSLKSSPILRKANLKRFLIHLLEGLGALTPADIMDVMRRRFALVEPVDVELAEAVELAESPVHSQATQQDIARSVAARIGADHSRLLTALADHGDPAIAAKAAGSTKPAVRRAYADMLAMVTADAVEPNEVDHICGLVLEILFGDSE
jgi:hypothetical protein